MRATRCGRLAQALAVGVLADGQQDLAHGRLDAGVVDRAGQRPAIVFCLGTACTACRSFMMGRLA